MPAPLFTMPQSEKTVAQQIKTVLLQDGHLLDYVQNALKDNDIYVACRPIPNGSLVVKVYNRVSGKYPKVELEDRDGLHWFLVIPQEGKLSKDLKVLSVETPAIGEYDFCARMTVIITNCDLAEAA